MYKPSDDTFLLRSVLRNYKGGAFLEIGAGDFGSFMELKENFNLLVGTDIIKPEQIGKIKGIGEIVIADSATCFRDQSFDLVAFNPPYLPSDDIIDKAVDGGKEGIEIAVKFLSEAMRVMKKDGKIVFLLSSHNPIHKVKRIFSKKGLRIRKVAEKRLFFETLYVFEACNPL